MRRIYLYLIFALVAGSMCAAEVQIIDAKKSAVYGGVYSCEGLGDINGDGKNDFLLGLWISNQLELYLGGPAPFDNPPVLIWPNHGSIVGAAPFPPVNVGDVDCDGTTDFISAFAGDDTLKLFLGLDSLDPSNYLVMYGEIGANWDNFIIDGGGDNNNDGRTDFWILKQYTGDTLYGYSGCDLLDSAYDFKIIPSREPDNKFRAIWGLCTSYDLNGDSIPDIVYGQPCITDTYPGRVCIVWGDENLSEEPDIVFHGTIPDDMDQFGKGVACLKDISGDGIDDLWVTQGNYNIIYYGGQPFDTIPDLVFYYQNMYGSLVKNIGDINHDGYNDIQLVLNGSLFSYVSYVYCYPGMDTLVDAAFSNNDFYYALLDGPVDDLGYMTSWCGDVNGDGIDDALVTASTIGLDVGYQGRASIQSGWQEPVAVDDDPAITIPDQLDLRQNYPNPFNPSTTIEFTLPRAGHTEVVVYNLLGEIVAKPVAAHLQDGEHRIEWDGRDANGNAMPTGVYFYSIESGDYSATRKMVLLK